MKATLKNGMIYFCRLNTTLQQIEVFSNSRYEYPLLAELEEKSTLKRDFLFIKTSLFTTEEIILTVTSIDYVSLTTKTIDFKALVEIDG